MDTEEFSPCYLAAAEKMGATDCMTIVLQMYDKETEIPNV